MSIHALLWKTNKTFHFLSYRNISFKHQFHELGPPITIVINFAAPRLIIAAIYRYLGETMKILWHRDLFMNTVHVYDLCRAIHFVVHNPNTLGEIYNVVDEGRTTQGTVNDIVAKLFDIKTVYIDTIITTLFKDKVRSNHDLI